MKLSGLIVLKPTSESTVFRRVVVSLVDAAMADRPAMTVCETAFDLAPPLAEPIPFQLSVPDSRLPRNRWLFDARVTADPSGCLAAGDYLLTRSVEWHEALSTQTLILTLTLIS